MRYLEYAGLAVVGLLFFIWPIPHTISIRYISIFIALFILSYLFFRSRPSLPTGLLVPLLIYGAITAWMLLAAFFISADTARTLDEIRSQWLMGIVAGVIGGLIALAGTESGVITGKRVLLIIFSALAIHVLYVDMVGLVGYFATGDLPRAVAGFTEGRDKSSYLTNHLLMMLGAEFLYRTLSKRRAIPVGPAVLFSVAVLALFSVYVEGARNGTAAVLLSCAAMLVFYLITVRVGFKQIAVAAVLLALLAGFGYNSVRTDPRWQSFKETIPLALDTEGNLSWLNLKKYPPPKLKSGKEVTGSNYERIAWFKEGVKLVAERPLGIGFDRVAFGRALKVKYGETGPGHSHSGFIDLAVGTGLPGVLMWCALLIYLMAASIKQFIKHKNCFALMALFTVGNFSMRMMVDSNIRDHMLQQFIFLTAFFFTAMLKEDRGATSGAG